MENIGNQPNHEHIAPENVSEDGIRWSEIPSTEGESPHEAKVRELSDPDKPGIKKSDPETLIS